MNESARLKLPFLVPGQAQKELFHNEALQLLDMLVQPIAEGAPLNDPPPAAVVGQAYLTGADPTGAWAGHTQALACLTESGWRFCDAFEGMGVRLRYTGERACFRDGTWEIGLSDVRSIRVDGQQVLSSQAQAISSPAGGSTIDSQARSVLAAVLDALRHHGLIARV